MSRRGRAGPTISLFSFQDIITSVTAIVTVIALLLALDLVQRKQSQASDSSASLAADVVKSLERAEAELARLQAAANTTDDLVREAAAMSPGEVRSEIAERESSIVELEREQARLERQRRTWQIREKEKRTEQFDLQPARDEQVNVTRSLAGLERQRVEEAGENRTVFSLPRGMQKEGWLVVVESGEISVAPLGRSAKPRTFGSSGLALFHSSAAAALGTWIEEQRLGAAYFLVLIRPEGSAEFDEVQELLKRKSISYGFDLIGADQVVLHPERGAAP